MLQFRFISAPLQGLNRQMRKSQSFLGQLNTGALLSSLVLSAIFLLPRGLFDLHLLHEEEHHHETACEESTPTECHLTVFHEEYAESCGHGLHITEVAQECKLCDLARLLTSETTLLTHAESLHIFNGSYPLEVDKSILKTQNYSLHLKRGPPMI